MAANNRRTFLSHVGGGMLAAGLGATLAGDLGLSTASAEEAPDSISLNEHERLINLMRETPPDKLQSKLVGMLQKGDVDLKQLTAAGALANAVTFGGCDYVGFHTAMAMLPALGMSKQLPTERAALPVLKVLYRNAEQIQNVGGGSKKALYEIDALEAQEHAPAENIGEKIRDACRNVNPAKAEKLLAQTCDEPINAFNAIQLAVQDDLNVHRFVFAHRTYGLVGLLGEEYAYSLLRQCVRLCADHEKNRKNSNRPASPIRTVVPKLLDEYKLTEKKTGKRDPGDEAVEKLSRTIYESSRQDAAEAVAAAIAEGIDPEVIGEAISLASNLYVLCQGTKNWRTHGDSPGVHSSDATNAWRNMIRVADPKYTASALIVAAYHAGVQSPPFRTPAYPTDDHRALVKQTDATRLLTEAEDAIKNNDQGRAAAAIAIYGDQGHPVDRVFELMLKYTVSEDGRLHGEKYFHTVREEYRTIRPAFRWRQIVGLARVTASAYGYNRKDKKGFRAAGYEDACRLLGVKA